MMAVPKRGEIWHVKWGGKQGTELGAGKVYDERPCLIVSHDRFYVNKNGQRESDRLTVVPLTHYELRKEVVRSLWSVIITNRDDVDIDRRYTTRQLKLWETDEQGNYSVDEHGRMIPYKSIIDCGQISTIYTTFQDDQYNDLCWDRRHGELKIEKILSVDAALQVVLNGNVRSKQDLPVREGNVLVLKLLKGDQEFYQRCLVVSSTGIDAIREHLEVKVDNGTSTRKLGHCTVVPLEAEDTYKNAAGEADILVYPEKNQGEPQIEIAQCDEVYTVDWRARDGEVVGKVLDHDMKRVREELWKYLALPL